MHITYTQNEVIKNLFGNYNREKSSIIFEAGGVTISDFGYSRFIGSFIAHIYRKGKYRFDCKFVKENGVQKYVVEHKKI